MIRFPQTAMIATLAMSWVSAQSAQTGADKLYDPTMDLQFAEDLHANQVEEAGKPLADLQTQYRTALEKYRDKLQADGNLDGLVAAQAALDDGDAGKLPNGKSPDPQIAKLENVYLSHRPEIAKQVARPIAKADQEYLLTLDNLVKRLTREGHVAAAQTVQKKLRETSLMLKNLGKPETKEEPAPASVELEVKVVSANYGSGGKNADVTLRVKELVEKKRTRFSVSPKDLGADPAPGWNKALKIKFLKNGVSRIQNRGENEIVLPASFYGPQGGQELATMLADTQWKSDIAVAFNPDKTGFVVNRLATFQWRVTDSKNKVTLIWPDSGEVVCEFNSTFDSFKEKSGENRVFKREK